MKHFLSLVLTLCIILSCVFTVNFTAFDTQALTVDVSTTDASTGPQSDIEGSAILHCFNWSYNSIRSNLSAIKEAGYTAVQTSPVQSPKDYNGSWNDQNGQWWKMYQPLDFSISSNTWLGNKNDLKSLCTEAEKMGIKVVVDVVANHVANNHEGGGYNNVNGGVAQNLKRWEYYHDYNEHANDSSRYSMTMGHIGMPDLNTAHPDVQNIVKNLLIECINVGVDGFRFDAAKHIELPTDQDCGSDFWPNVIEGSQKATSNKIFYYGEILNGCGTDIGNYTRYMSVTDNYSSDAVLVAVNNGNASAMANSNYAKGAQPGKTVLWVESHDTHMGSYGSAGLSTTSSISDDKIVKAWAIVGSRADATSLYFARPGNNMGQASSNTTWKSKPVAEINKFKNYFDGQKECLSSDNSIAYVERGTTGVVLVNANGGSTSVNVPAKMMQNGTYKDTVTGNTFTVQNGRISGNIGNTGVAVVYDPSNSVTPTEIPTQKPTETQASKVRIYLGDVNQDTEINILDATAIQKHIATIDVRTGKALKAGDVNQDAALDIMDATIIQRYLAGHNMSNSYCGKYIEIDDNEDPTTPTVVVPVGDYVYYKNTNNWSNVKIYYWSDDDTQMISWPGKDMKSCGDNVYYVDVPDDIDYVIFNNGESNQTENIRFEGIKKIYENGSWSNFGGTVTPTQPQQTPTQAQTQPATSYVPVGNYIYYKNNDNWGEVKVYYWSDSNSSMTSWPGLHMEHIGDNVYKAEIPSEVTMVVFNNNNQGQQTPDIRLEGMNKIYDNGSWRDYTL